jgi:hypothetical protein
VNGRDVLRWAAAVAVGVGGYEHFDLYRHGYRAIDHIGPLFAANVVVSAGLVAALLSRRDLVTRLVALAFTALSLGAFVLSRTSGLLGFKEVGLDPRPQAPATIVAEVAALVLLAIAVALETLPGRQPSPRVA